MQSQVRILLFLALVVCAGTAFGAVIHVPSDQPAIQAGIDASSSGDVILVAPGTYSENIDFKGKTIVLISEAGPASTILRPADNWLPTVSIQGYVGEMPEISGFTLTGSRSRVIVIGSSASPTISRNVFVDNPNVMDVAIYSDGANPLILFNLFVRSANISAVGIYNGSATIVNNTFDGNRRGFFTISGAGVARNNIVTNSLEYGVYGNFTEFDYNDIWNNHPDYEGGAISGPHDISQNPAFQAPSSLDYTLQPGSPCIDAGDPSPQFNDPDGSRSDMGYASLGGLPRAAIPHLVQEDPLHVLGHTPTFEWVFVDNANLQSAYEIEVGTDLSWDVVEMWSTGVVVSAASSVVYSGLPLVDGAGYYWRIRLSNGTAWGDWKTSFFRMNSPPSVPVPNRPLDGASARVKALRLFVNNSTDAEADPLVYDFEIYSDPAMTLLVGSQTGVTQTASPTSSAPFPPLPDFPEYWWRARVSDGFQYSDWTAPLRFTPRTGPILVPSEQPTIQSGLDVAMQNDTVLVAPGTYREYLTLNLRAITLMSTGGPSLTTITTQSGPNLYLSNIQGETPFSLKGFTIAGNGTGVAAENSRFTIEECNFEGRGYLVHFSGYSSNGTIRGCRFISAQPGSGIGILVDNLATLVLARCLFVKLNYGVLMSSGVATLTNNTFDQNQCGVLSQYATVTARNNIIANSVNAGFASGSISSDYNDLWNNHPNYESGAVAGAHDIDLDPRFRDPAGLDYSLMPISPCINAGDPDPQYLDPDGTRNDLGAYPLLYGLPTSAYLNLGPENANHVVSHTPSFHWSFLDSVGSQVGYELEVGTDTIWNAAELWATGPVIAPDSVVPYSGAPLTDGSTCYWRLRLYNGTIWGGWREAGFHMNSIPSVPLADSPTGGVRTCPARLRLYIDISTDAEADRLGYDFQIFGDAALANRITSQSNVPEDGIPTGSQEFDLPGQPADYWWRARAYDGYEHSAWTVAEHFVIRPALLHVPADWPTPAAAIAASCSGDTVLLAHGTYSGGIDPLGKEIVIAGELPLGSTIVTNVPYAPPITIMRGEGIRMIVRDLAISGGWEAAGILISGASPSIINNLITTNYGGGFGGGIRIQGGGGPVIRGNRITGNSALQAGGGIYVGTGTSAIIDQNVITGNQAGNGSALAQEGGGNLLVIGNTMSANFASATPGGAVFTSQRSGGGSNFRFEHNTIAGNTSWAGQGAGIVCDYSNGGEITNNIIAFNNGGYGVYACGKAGASPVVQFNDLWWNDSGPYGCVTPDTGNIFADPRFCDTSLQDFQLAANSPCLGSGADSTTIGALGQGCATASPLMPVCKDIRVDPPRPPEHVVNKTPQIQWTYTDPGSRPHQCSEIQVGTDNDWTLVEMWAPPVILGPQTAIIYSGLPLSEGQWYTVRVRVRNDTLWSNWVQSAFRLNSKPTAPALYTPGNNVALATARPTLTIQASADGDNDSLTYTFAVYSDSTLNTPVDSVAGTSSLIWTTDSLTRENQKHWWRVRANDGFESSDWSPVRSFWVNAIKEPPTAFNLRTPNDGVALYTPHPAFAWDPPADPDPRTVYSYTITISLNPTFTFTQDMSTFATSFTWPESLYIRATYWWRVSADDHNGDTITSPVRRLVLAWPGDLTGDRLTDVFDVIMLIGYAFGGGDAPSPLNLGDVNGDCVIDVLDVIDLIRYVFEDGPEPVAGCL